MGLNSTNSLMWVPVATLLTTITFGCDGTDDAANGRESEFARKAAAVDAGIAEASEDDVSILDGSIASLDGATMTTSSEAGASSDVEDDAAVELTDNQIFGILAAYNDAELSAAAAGEGKLQDAAAVALARAATRSATAARTRHSLLGTLARLEPEPSDERTERERIEGDINAMLEDEPASDSLDLRYAFGEAMTNSRLVELIDTTLAPQADDELLKNELRTTREAAARRVTEAGEIVTALSPRIAPEEGPESDVTDEDTVSYDAGVDANDAGVKP